MAFRPMLPETIARRARERVAERLAALPDMIARREAMARQSTHQEDVTHWQSSAAALRIELSRYE